MFPTRIWLAAFFLALMAATGSASPGEDCKQDCKPTPTPSSKSLEIPELAARIDAFIEAQLAAKGIAPAPLASDAEFLRRVYLDLAGRIPTEAEARTFLADKSANRRGKLVDSLLGSPLFVRNMASTWQNVMAPSRNNNTELVSMAEPGFKSWLDKQVQENVPYDKMVRELLTAPIFSPMVMNPYGIGFSNPGIGGINPGLGGINPGFGGINPGFGNPGLGGINPGLGAPGLGGINPGFGINPGLPAPIPAIPPANLQFNMRVVPAVARPRCLSFRPSAALSSCRPRFRRTGSDRRRTSDPCLYRNR